jgi:CheY-like chemotaxis protein
MSIVLQFSSNAGKPGSSPDALSFKQILLEPRDGHRVVLVMVDDDEEDCMLVNEALKQACPGCTFRCVGDGDQLLDYLHRSSRDNSDHESTPPPDIILLDLNMPRMDGRKVLKILKEDPLFRAIPVVILTTSKELEDVKACYDLGANSYITKQSSFEEMVLCVKTLMEYWIEVATLPRKKTRRDVPDDEPGNFS